MDENIEKKYGKISETRTAKPEKCGPDLNGSNMPRSLHAETPEGCILCSMPKTMDIILDNAKLRCLPARRSQTKSAACSSGNIGKWYKREIPGPHPVRLDTSALFLIGQ